MQIQKFENVTEKLRNWSSFSAATFAERFLNAQNSFYVWNRHAIKSWLDSRKKIWLRLKERTNCGDYLDYFDGYIHLCVSLKSNTFIDEKLSISQTKKLKSHTKTKCWSLLLPIFSFFCTFKVANFVCKYSFLVLSNTFLLFHRYLWQPAVIKKIATHQKTKLSGG